ncbi:MAG: hypothetical protein MUE79_05945 [Nitratireductor sp.]|nr:hypothetical protein [Nitratireductor sp.]
MAGHIIVRLVLVFIGLLVAFAAAGIFMAFGLFAGFFSDLFASAQVPQAEVAPLTALAVLAVGLFSSFQIASLAFAPAALAILVAELAGWRGLVANLLLGGLVGLATGWILTAGEPGAISGGSALVLLSAGFVGSFFYWLVAGRGAGGWRG